MSPTRVLISDNSADYATLLGDCISMYPEIEVVGTALDGEGTIEMLQRTTPDILLLDILMPRMDGMEVLRTIHKSEHKPLVFIISALGNEKIIRTALSLGASKYFVKPIPIESLISEIRKSC